HMQRQSHENQPPKLDNPHTMAELPQLTDLETFLINTPLYASYLFTEVAFATLIGTEVRVDGQCLQCEERSTFRTSYDSYGATADRIKVGAPLTQFMGPLLLEFH